MRLQPIVADAVTGGALAEFMVNCRAFRQRQISSIGRKKLSRFGHESCVRRNKRRNYCVTVRGSVGGAAATVSPRPAANFHSLVG
jgi:hypothetical protein